MSLFVFLFNRKFAGRMLVGNKCDLKEQRVITNELGENLAKKFSCTFMEASAKDKVHVDDIFHDLVRQINASSGSSDKDGKKKKSSCSLL